MGNGLLIYMMAISGCQKGQSVWANSILIVQHNAISLVADNWSSRLGLHEATCPVDLNVLTIEHKQYKAKKSSGTMLSFSNSLRSEEVNDASYQ